jgi:hypothetical protein
MQEVAARGGKIILITDEAGAAASGGHRQAHHPGAGLRQLHCAAGLLGADPIAGVFHGRAQRHGRRSAAQPREIGDGGMSKLRAGVLGAGAFGRIHARKYAEDARVHFVGVYDPDDERAGQLADTHGAESFTSLDALLAEIDILTIASPPSFHAANARAALLAGKHVLMEKPLATDANARRRACRHRAANKLCARLRPPRALGVRSDGAFECAGKPDAHRKRARRARGRAAAPTFQ